jgi:hypothetical protein
MCTLPASQIEIISILGLQPGRQQFTFRSGQELFSLLPLNPRTESASCPTGTERLKCPEREANKLTVAQILICADIYLLFLHVVMTSFIGMKRLYMYPKQRTAISLSGSVRKYSCRISRILSSKVAPGSRNLLYLCVVQYENKVDPPQMFEPWLLSRPFFGCDSKITYSL